MTRVEPRRVRIVRRDMHRGQTVMGGLIARMIMGLVAAAFWVVPVAAQGDASNTCISCHASLEDEDMSEPVGQWQRGVHNPAGIACQDCHGGNPASLVEDDAHSVEAGFIGEPEPEEIHEVCASCHQLQTDNYLPSPHGIESEFWPSCTDCHSNHEVKHPVVAEISIPANCEDCHEQDIMDDFITVVDRGLNPLADFNRAAEEIESSGVPVALIMSQANLAKDAFRTRASHVFVMANIIATVDSLEKTYTKIEKDLDLARTEVETRRKFGWLLASIFVIMAGVIWLYKRALPDE